MKAKTFALVVKNPAEQSETKVDSRTEATTRLRHGVKRFDVTISRPKGLSYLIHPRAYHLRYLNILRGIYTVGLKAEASIGKIRKFINEFSIMITNVLINHYNNKKFTSALMPVAKYFGKTLKIVNAANEDTIDSMKDETTIVLVFKGVRDGIVYWDLDDPRLPTEYSDVTGYAKIDPSTPPLPLLPPVVCDRLFSSWDREFVSWSDMIQIAKKAGSTTIE